MFGFMKKRLFKRMLEYSNSISISVYRKLRRDFEEESDQEKAGRLAAAVTNRLFGQEASSEHDNISDTTIDKVASDFLKNEGDKEILNGIVMSLRTLMTFHTDVGDNEAMDRTSSTLQWIKTIIPLPSEEPDPSMMEYLAAALQSRYQQ